MMRRATLICACAVAMAVACVGKDARAQQPAQPRAYGQSWGYAYNTQDWNRFYHYPYVFYPQNFYGPEYYQSADSLYYRYPPEMRIPVYNRQWQNEYPQDRRYHWGHHFQLDVF